MSGFKGDSGVKKGHVPLWLIKIEWLIKSELSSHLGFIIAFLVCHLQQQVHLQLMTLFLQPKHQVHALISKIYHF